MNLGKLFMLQSELDAHIEQQHPREKRESRHKEKVLALLVELGELANETRCFKYWSNKPASEKAVILEEFSDGIHFLLSIGLENNIEELKIKPIKKQTLTEQFIGLYNVFTILHIHFSPEVYSEAWSAYIGLADMLGFTWKEIEQAYLAKNQKNHDRQDGGY
jgi:dimeric dUTPase (all-alpha-NTP-PPase superfamily)